MPSARRRSASARLVRAAAVATVAATGFLVPTVLAPSVAAADEPVATTVVGQFVQTWSEPALAAGHVAAPEPLSWIETPDGSAVRVPTDQVPGLRVGSTVAVTVGGQAAEGDDDAADEGHAPAREVLTAEEIAPTEIPAPPAARALTNEVTVALVAPAGAPHDAAVTAQDVADVVDGAVADFWREQTGGAVSLGVTATRDWIDTTAGCADPAKLWNEAAAKADFTGGAGRHLLLYVSPAAAGCAYALAEVGSAPAAGGRLYVTENEPSIIAHEFGHNFGLGHSSARQCDAAVETGTCRTVPYGDLYDVMGASWDELGSLNAAQAVRLGVLPAAQQAAFTATDAGGAVQLAPLSGRDGVRALRLTDGDGVDYWLEYRSTAGQDSWLRDGGNGYALEAGVLLRRADGFPDTSLLLDGTPSPAPGWDPDRQVALPVGVAVPVSGGDFTVTVQAITPTGAALSVAVAPAPAPVAVPPAQGGRGAAGPMESGGAQQPPPQPAPESPPAPWVAGTTFWVDSRTPGIELLPASSSDGMWGLIGAFALAGLAGGGVLIGRFRAAARAARLGCPD